MVPAIADFIKSNGLALVVDRSCDAGRPEPQGGPMVDPFPRLPSGIDGLLEGNGVLRFNESIDV